MGCGGTKGLEGKSASKTRVQQDMLEGQDADAPAFERALAERPYMWPFYQPTAPEAAHVLLACQKEVRGFVCAQLLGFWLYVVRFAIRRAKEENFEIFAKLISESSTPWRRSSIARHFRS